MNLKTKNNTKGLKHKQGKLIKDINLLFKISPIHCIPLTSKCAIKNNGSILFFFTEEEQVSLFLNYTKYDQI